MVQLKWRIFILSTFTVVLAFLYLFLGKDKMKPTELLPGIYDMDSSLLESFKKMKKKKGSSYRPRTRHLTPKGEALFTNRLFLEKSPYLLQHAHNPVNWYPWGEEAFQSARKENKPVLLSVGYSTCHWCHVMEEESFEDLEIAKYINENYIAIKVDREERPDIDSVYMNAVQIITGRGGWPMTVWLTPDKQVFYGGTYFPPRTGDRGSSTGFLSILKELKKAYEERKEHIKRASADIQNILQKSLSPSLTSTEAISDKDIFPLLYSQIKSRWDPVYGGARGAPKFPSSFPIRVLLRSYLKTKKGDVLQMAKLSLDEMSKGGMHDQVGGGFHRYSTDEKWLVPHFEKMLYDQALLALSYLEAYQLFSQKSLFPSQPKNSVEQQPITAQQSTLESYKETATGILDYIMRDMQSKEGGFYSATDADSLVYEDDRPSQEDRHSGESRNPENKNTHKKEEGFYFTWTPEEVDQALNKQQAELVKKYYGVTSNGNFEGRNIFYISKKLSEVAKELKLELSQAKKILDEARNTLYQTRERRPLPLRDEKILSGWNGLMISAFVYGYFVLNEKKYLSQAEKSARFVLNNMYKKGRLYRSWKDGEAYIPAYLDDYAFFTSALLDLFEWTGNIDWLNKSIELDQILEKDFEDKDKGGFFMTGQDYESLLVREKPLYDGAEPSGNSIAIMNLLRLKELTGNNQYKLRAEKAFRAFGKTLKDNPFSFSEALLALDYYRSRANEIVLVLPDDAQLESNSFFNELKSWYLPNKVLTVVHNSQVEKHQKLLKPISRKKAMNKKTTAYICEEGACQLPATDLKEFRRQLAEIQSFDYK